MTILKFRRWLQIAWLARDLSPLIGQDETKLLNELTRRKSSQRSYSKVFLIGANKTGTTTVESVLKSLSFRMPPQIRQEKLLSHVLVSGEYDLLRRFVSKYDAFQDLPFSQERIYIALDALFPNSKFILTLRDPEDWFQSLVRFHAKVYETGDDSVGADHFRDREIYLHRNYTYEQARRHVSVVEAGQVVERWERLYDKDARIAAFNQRNDEIIRYFRNRQSDLLTLDVSRESDTRKICEFLLKDQSQVQSMPWLNKTDEN